MNKPDLFIQLAKPNSSGVSRWVEVTEFIGNYSSLAFGNGADWARKESTLAKRYVIEFDKSVTPGSRIDRVRLNGFNDNPIGTQVIRPDIKQAISARRCIVLGTSKPEVDHKNGRKIGRVVEDVKSQKLSDFQPLSKAANDAKRQFCKECRQSNIRYDATLLGYPISYYKGGEDHDGTEIGCEGCFWYDPIEFRRHLKEKE